MREGFKEKLLVELKRVVAEGRGEPTQADGTRRSRWLPRVAPVVGIAADSRSR